ncbi:unnamed protein product [Anisakis simplex]|uniref:PRKR-interacting protein 1 (inferred by orthology to a human protein) n=1 Tax=Anisakis simplex TaxID=6269 RepID=A0A0M3JW25_ANISI|nr:unnamed protein product [Anisakis simplex]
MPHEDKEQEEEQRARTAYDLIRMRLDRLEKNIVMLPKNSKTISLSCKNCSMNLHLEDKPVSIPQRRDARKPRPPPDFVRNVVGSSAAAGSAEFHIFRNNRKREMDRLDYMNQKALQEELDAEYIAKRERQIKQEEEKTAKKRAKRQRHKEKMKRLKKKKIVNKGTDGSGSEEDSSDSDGNSHEESRCCETKSEQPSENVSESSNDNRKQSDVTKTSNEVRSCDGIENVKANGVEEEESLHSSCAIEQHSTCTVQQHSDNNQELSSK